MLLNVQLPDSATVERTQRMMARIEKTARGDPDDPEHYPGVPGVAHTLGVSGRSMILEANAPNLGSLYVMLKPFDEAPRRQPDSRRDRQRVEEPLCQGGAWGRGDCV